MKDVAIVSTPDAVFVAPVSYSQNVKKIVEQLEKKRPPRNQVHALGRPGRGQRRRGASASQHWLFEETLPLWSTAGVDEVHGGFHEALGFDARSLGKPKRMRTMARQIYAFAVAKERGWDGPADRLIGPRHRLHRRNTGGRIAAAGCAR